MTTNISLFQGKTIRKTFHGDGWWFSVVDVVGALTDSVNPRDYWFKMKARVQAEDGFEPSTVCRQMKLSAEDGKMRETDCANIEGIFRIIQSIPSPKAEPFKLWLAKAGYERVQEIADPERSVDRARENWQKHGRSEKWNQERMTGQETRNKLTDYWSGHGVKKGDEFAVLTNIIHEEWSGLTVGGHKNIKGLRSQNLRDHMNEAELIFTALAELSTRQIAETMQAEGFEKNKLPAKKGGQIAKDERKALEDKTGKSVVSEDNFLPPGTSKKRVKYLT